MAVSSLRSARLVSFLNAAGVAFLVVASSTAAVTTSQWSKTSFALPYDRQASFVLGRWDGGGSFSKPTRSTMAFSPASPVLLSSSEARINEAGKKASSLLLREFSSSGSTSGAWRLPHPTIKVSGGARTILASSVAASVESQQRLHQQQHDRSRLHRFGISIRRIIQRRMDSTKVLLADRVAMPIRKRLGGAVIDSEQTLDERLEASEAPPLAVEMPTNGKAFSSSQSLVDEAELEERLQGLTEPAIPAAMWRELTGTEFQEHPDRLDALAAMGESLARNDEPASKPPGIKWSPYQGKKKGDLEDGSIHVWTGWATNQDRYGHQVPFIKTRSVVPMTPLEMADLLMDSDKVKTYNQWSLGRRDCWVAPTNVSSSTSHQTKIVKNRTQPPIGSKAVVSTTLLHARPLSHDTGSWLVVSRSVGGSVFCEDDDAGASRSDILLGVNLLQPYGEDSTILTAITHAYASSIPTMLAERLGVSGSIKFVKDMRALQAPASQ